MDSGFVGADGNRDLSVVLPRKSEVCIVYTRKNRRKAPSNINSDAPAAAKPSVSGLESASVEPCDSTSPARSCRLNDEDALQLGLEAIPAGHGNFVEQGVEADAQKEYLFHDTEILLEGSSGVEEALPNGGAELQPHGELQNREERQLRGTTGGDALLLPEESRGGEEALPNGGAKTQAPCELGLREGRLLSGATGGKERLLDGGAELLSNYGKELDVNNRKEWNGESQKVAREREELQVDASASQAESLNNSKELEPSIGHDGGEDDLNDTGDLTILTNSREEPQLSVGQVTVPLGGSELLASGHERHPNGVSSVVLRNCVLKPVISVVEDRVKIAISESNSKVELKGLKRKIENELDQVRILMRKLEAKSVQIAALNTSITTGRPTYISSGVGNVGFYDQPHLMRINSMVGASGHPETRPFRHLSVSVMENNHGVGEFVEKEKRTPKANKFYLNSQFLLGKDRLPTESNKKHKPNGAGSKHGVVAEHGAGFGFSGDRNRDKVFRSCSNLLQRLMKHKHGWVFNSPVDAEKLGLHDYHDIIKHPMDFGTIKTRISQNWYRSARQFAEDVRLVFHNAMTYNPKGQDVHTMAEELSATFEDKWASIERECFPYQMYYDAGLPTPTPRKSHPLPPPMLPPMLPPLSIPTPRSAPPMRTFDRSKSLTIPVTRPANMDIPHTVRTPVLKKPKAKDLNKRDMTYEEKQKLSTNLQSLPSEKLDAVVQIINKRNSGLSQHNDEIEVDIDSVEAETLWELDRFVTNYKKSLSKNKRKAELALAEQAQAAASQTALQTNPAPAAVDAQREGAPGGDINREPVQAAITGDNASPSSSSSSSSSDSGSSSSDSDSDSSSASEDAGRSPKT